MIGDCSADDDFWNCLEFGVTNTQENLCAVSKLDGLEGFFVSPYLLLFISGHAINDKTMMLAYACDAPRLFL